jgi:hypothetical protein
LFVQASGALRARLAWLLVRPASSLLLLTLGVHSVEDQELDARAIPVRPSCSGAHHEVRGAGDVIVSNHTSALDVLLLASRFPCLFLRSALDGSVKCVSAWEAFWSEVWARPQASFIPERVESAMFLDDSDLVARRSSPPSVGVGIGNPHGAVKCRKAGFPPEHRVSWWVRQAQLHKGGPVCLFFEGPVRTNGRAVILACEAARDLALGGTSPRLGSDSEREEAAAMSRALVLHYVCLTYSPWTPSHPLERGWPFLQRVMSASSVSATVRRLAEGREPQLLDCKGADEGGTRADASCGDMHWDEAAQAVLVKMLRSASARPVQWSAADYCECLDYAANGRLPLRKT